MSVHTCFESATESRLWVMMNLHGVEKAKNRALAEPVLEKLKMFCQEMRAAKLRYLDRDRQEPGEFDEGAGMLVDWADEVVEMVDAQGSAALSRVRGGITIHRVELAEHLNVPLDEREVIS